ncbi:MAG: MIP/aquaporin family protein, partial [Gemmataceae bacterium]
YYSHWELTQDPDAKRAVFCTAPAVRNPWANFFCEIIATFVLVLGVLAISSPKNLIPDSGFAQGFGPVLVGLLVWSIGLSLGGPTGFAINPARDLAPRLFHSLFPISGKGGSDWGYAWIPVFGPIIGGILGAIVYAALWPSP